MQFMVDQTSEPKRIRGYTGWKISEAVQSRLLELIPPKYTDVVADHITDKFNVYSTEPLSVSHSAHVVGVADNGQCVQALVVAIDGSTVRLDGKVFHITWSLDRASGAKPVHSNDVIHTPGCVTMLDQPILIVVEPMFFPFNGHG